MADKVTRFSKDNILEIPVLQPERNYESEGRFSSAKTETTTETSVTEDPLVTTLEGLDAVYMLSELLPAGIRDIIQNITEVLQLDTQGKIILEMVDEPPPSGPVPTTGEPSSPKPAQTEGDGPVDVIETALPPELGKPQTETVVDIFSSEPLFTITVQESPSLVQLAHKAYLNDDSDIKNHYVDQMRQLTQRFYQVMVTMATEVGFPDYSYLLQDFDASAVKTNDPNQRHLLDKIIKNQILYGQKIRQMNKTHTAENTLIYLRGMIAAEGQRERYIQEEYKKSMPDYISTFSNDLLEAARKESDEKYRNAVYNYYKYLDSSTKYVNTMLNMKIDEASAKAQLANTGSDIFAYTPPPAATPNKVDDNYESLQAQQKAVVQGIKTQATDSQASGGAKGGSWSGTPSSGYQAGTLGGGSVDPGVVYKQLRAFGYSPVSACGIMGNIQQESTFNTNADSGSHRGLFQWGYGADGNRWGTFESMYQGKDLYDAGNQLNFMYYEATNTRCPEECSPSGMNANCSTPQEASHWWQIWFEGAPGQEDEERAHFAESFYQTYNT